MKILKPVLPVLLAGMLAGCTSLAASRPDATAFAPTPSSGAAAIARAMGGGLVGGEIGAGLDDRDRQLALAAEYKALEHTPAGTAIPWSNERSGRSGEVVPAQPYRVGSQDCRQYTHKVVSGAAAREARGTACRNPDGSWTPLT